MLTLVFERIVNAETRGKLHLYLIGDALMGNDSLKERFREKYHEWHLTLEKGLKTLFQDQPASYELLSQLLLATLDGFLIQKMMEMDTLPLEGAAAVYAHLIQQ